MIKVLKGSEGLIKFLESQGGINSGRFEGRSNYVYYYINSITNIIECIYPYDITNNPKKYTICNMKQYKKEKKLINYLEI